MLIPETLQAAKFCTVCNSSMFFLVVLAHTDEQYNFNLLNTRELIIVINIRLSNRCREKVLDLCVGVEKKYLIYCVSFCFITGYICGRSERRVTRSSTTVSLCYSFLVLSSFQSARWEVITTIFKLLFLIFVLYRFLTSTCCLN